jgi:hypothetical protein
LLAPVLQRQAEERAEDVIVRDDASLADQESGSEFVVRGCFDAADAGENAWKQLFIPSHFGPILRPFAHSSVLHEHGGPRDEQDEEVECRFFIRSELNLIAFDREALRSGGRKRQRRRNRLGIGAGTRPEVGRDVHNGTVDDDPEETRNRIPMQHVGEHVFGRHPSGKPLRVSPIVLVLHI